MKLIPVRQSAMGSIWMCHFFLLLSILGTTFIETTANNATDSYWLHRIKSELVDPFGALSNWSSTTQVCNWNGITCAVDQEHIIGLNLSGSGISGSISAAHVIQIGRAHV